MTVASLILEGFLQESLQKIDIQSLSIVWYANKLIFTKSSVSENVEYKMVGRVLAKDESGFLAGSCQDRQHVLECQRRTRCGTQVLTG